MKEYQLVPCISSEKIQQRLDELGELISKDYLGRDLVLVGILKGAFVFLADLVRRVSLPVEVDFIRLASYGDKSATSGAVQITKDIELPIEGRDVLIVEDIVDTGVTLSWLVKHLEQHRPRSMKICALIDKAERRQVPLHVDYVGIKIDKGFIVGYGLDFSERHRNLPCIYEVQFLE